MTLDGSINFVDGAGEKVDNSGSDVISGSGGLSQGLSSTGVSS